MKPRAVLAEDEVLLREQLAELLAAAWPELDIVACAEDGKQALQALETLQPDILFLDIQMPEASGLEVARRASGRCHVVFVTAYDQYAVAAFEEGAVDYVMKLRCRAPRIATAVQRVKQRMQGAPANLKEGLLDAFSPILRSETASTCDGSTASRGDAGQDAIRKKLKEWVPIILAAQQPNGYLQTMYTLNGLRPWTNKGDHEGYTAGYFIESAIAHYLAFGKSPDDPMQPRGKKTGRLLVRPYRPGTEEDMV